MTRYILPAIVLAVVLFGIAKHVNIYASFVEGIRASFRLLVNIAPYIIAIMIMLELFEVSGLNDIMEEWLSPILMTLGIPRELSSLVIMRPLSGNGSIALLDDILAKYGADSYVGRCASIMVSASETVFYVTALYFSTTKVKRLRYTIPVALFSTLMGMVVACLIAKIM